MICGTKHSAVAVYRHVKPNGSRLRAAIASLPFEKPKLRAIAVGNGNDLADRLIAAIAATNQVNNARPMQVIEDPTAPQVVEAQVDEPPDHSGPFA